MFRALVALALPLVIAGCIESSKRTEAHDPNLGKPGYLTKMYAPESAAPNEQLSRYVAAIDPTDDVETIAYSTYRPQNKTDDVKFVNQQLWASWTDGGRADLLKKMFYANSRVTSRTGYRHVACFTGRASKALKSFFNSGYALGGVTKVVGSYSADDNMIGLGYTDQYGSHSFRMASCKNGGKGELIKDYSQVSASRLPQSVDDDSATVTDVGVDAQQGFVINDKDKENANVVNFQLRADYQNASGSEAPWLDAGLDVSKADDQYKFALLLQKYVYENMGNQDLSNADNNFIAQKNSSRYWCHMPWLNQGSNGRESAHGMTQERNLQPNNMWADAPLGGDWGIGMFNATGCQGIAQVFGTSASPKAAPDWTKAKFNDGAVVFKILFTTATEYAPLAGAVKPMMWNAHVSEANTSSRKTRPVAHIQMDIGIKDSRLKGLAMSQGQLMTDGWIMLTYYFDAAYNSELTAAPYGMKLVEGLKHMRPMGLAMGYTGKETVIFPGAKTNQNAGLLNGPADNAKSNCIGCHASAGTHVSMAPGVKTAEQWYSVKAQGGTLDFGQQFALAKKNYETRAR